MAYISIVLRISREQTDICLTEYSFRCPKTVRRILQVRWSCHAVEIVIIKTQECAYVDLHTNGTVAEIVGAVGHAPCSVCAFLVWYVPFYSPLSFSSSLWLQDRCKNLVRRKDLCALAWHTVLQYVKFLRRYSPILQTSTSHGGF